MLVSVTRAARARSCCSNPNCSSRCRITNGTSTGFLLGPTSPLNSSMLIMFCRTGKLTGVLDRSSTPIYHHRATTPTSYLRSAVKSLARFSFRWRRSIMATATKAKTKLTVFPLADRVAIRPMEETEEMKGGLYIPDTAKEKPIQGEVIAVGPGRMEKGQRVPMELKVGVLVVDGKSTGSHVELEEEEIILIKESDVIAKLS